MRIPTSYRKSVVFLFAEFRNSNSGRDEPIAIGTGVIVSWQVGDGTRSRLYVVTANHLLNYVTVKASSKRIWIRVNKKGGGSHSYPSNLDEWHAHSEFDSVDVAVLQICPELIEEWDWSHVPRDRLATQAEIEKHQIGPGDLVQAVGLYTKHIGLDMNEVIVRTGHIASLPREPIDVKSYGSGHIHGVLVEIPSIGGLSGAPVFVNLTGQRINDEGDILTQAAPILLLGIVHGHWEYGTGKNSVHEGIAIASKSQQIAETIEQVESGIS